jgi:hypothetical protein
MICFFVVVVYIYDEADDLGGSVFLLGASVLMDGLYDYYLKNVSSLTPAK